MLVEKCLLILLLCPVIFGSKHRPKAKLTVEGDGTETTEVVATTTSQVTSSTITNFTAFNETPDKATFDPSFVEIRINKGMIRGKRIQVEDHSNVREVDAFLGIRYAEAPVGEKRFKPPEAAKNWSGVADVTSYGANCYQWRDNTFEKEFEDIPFKGTEMWNSNTEISEDCLFINVWTPNYRKRHLNVMVWIYGGGFYSGSSSLDVYDGKWLAATENVVVVSMNYRVAGLGFLAYDDKDIKGNAGLYDQRLALEWVQHNIHYFGGDRKHVTLFGESAGGASTSIHLASPGSAGLFKNVIIQSGSLLSPWAFISKTQAIERTKTLLLNLNCSESHPHSLFNTTTAEKKRLSAVKCLQEVDAKTLVDTEISKSYGTFRFPNAVIPSKDFVAFDPKVKFPQIPNNVSIMAGYNANEGNYFLIYGSAGWNLTTKSLIGRKDFIEGIKIALKNPLGDDASRTVTDIFTNYVDYVYTQSVNPDAAGYISKCSSSKNNQSKCTSDSHTGETTIDKSTFYRDRLDDMVGDVAVVCPLLDLSNQIKTETNNSKVFLYHFKQRSSQNPWPQWMGVMHGYEIEFVFGLPLDKKRNYTAKEQKLSRKMMRLWSNFAKHDDPNGSNHRGKQKWTEYTPQDRCINVLSSNTDGSSMMMTTLQDPAYSRLLKHCGFWDNYFPELYRLAASENPVHISAKCNGNQSKNSTENMFLLLFVILFQIV